MDIFRDICQTRPQEIFFLTFSGILQTTMFIYSIVAAVMGLHIMLVVTENIGPILSEDPSKLSVGISLELLAGFIVGIGICNAFVCTAFPCALYTILGVENQRLDRKKILAFALSQVILSFGILAIGVLTLLLRNRLDLNLETAIIDALQHYKSRLEIKSSIDRMQIYYKCCGSRTVSDWQITEWHHNVVPGRSIFNIAPYSCCDRFTLTPCLSKTDIALMGITLKRILKNIYFVEGCAEAVSESFCKYFLLPLGIISLVFFIVQIIGSLVSYLILCLMIEEKPKRKFQKLHFDMENFDPENCDLNKLASDCTCSADESSECDQLALRSSQYKKRKGKRNRKRVTKEKDRNEESDTGGDKDDIDPMMKKKRQQQTHKKSSIPSNELEDEENEEVINEELDNAERRRVINSHSKNSINHA